MKSIKKMFSHGEKTTGDKCKRKLTGSECESGSYCNTAGYCSNKLNNIEKCLELNKMGVDRAIEFWKCGDDKMAENLRNTPLDEGGITCKTDTQPNYFESVNANIDAKLKKLPKNLLNNYLNCVGDIDAVIPSWDGKKVRGYEKTLVPKAIIAQWGMDKINRKEEKIKKAKAKIIDDADKAQEEYDKKHKYTINPVTQHGEFATGGKTRRKKRRRRRKRTRRKKGGVDWWDETSKKERIGFLKEQPWRTKLWFITHPNILKNAIYQGSKAVGQPCTWNAIVSECGQGSWCENKECTNQVSKDNECIAIAKLTKDRTKDEKKFIYGDDKELYKYLYKKRPNCAYAAKNYENSPSSSTPYGLRNIQNKQKQAKAKKDAEDEEEDEAARQKKATRHIYTHLGGGKTRRRKRRRRRKSTKKKRRRRRKRTRK